MSAKLRGSTNEGLEDLEMDMSPMIDMVFLLLIFFIVASKIVTHHIDPDVKVPLGGSAQTPEMKGARIIINVYGPDPSKNGSTVPFASEYGRSSAKGKKFETVLELTNYIGDRKRWMNEMEGAELDEIGVVIRASRDADVGRVKRAVQAAADNGILTVTFSAFKEQPGSYYKPR